MTGGGPLTQTIVVASGKGGTGKTSITAGVGCALAELGRRCLLIDADVGMQSLDMALGVHNYAAFDFSDAARGNIALADAAVPLADFPQASAKEAAPGPEKDLKIPYPAAWHSAGSHKKQRSCFPENLH